MQIGGYHWTQNGHGEGFAIVPHFTAKEARLRSKPCVFGLELEITGAGTNVYNGRKILEGFGLEEHPNINYLAAKDYLFWYSRDCSIGESTDNGGLEIVTQPCSLKYHLEVIKWQQGLAKMEELGYKSWDGGRCGLHCHVPRAYFVSNTSNVEEIFTVVFNNMADDLKRFSGRDDFNYCEPFNSERFWSYKLKTAEQPNESNRISRTKNTASGGHHNRYHMVNFTNENTIEFRLFRGTTNYQTFVADLQLCYMLAEIGKRFSLEESCNVNWAYIKQFAQGLGFKEFLLVDKKRFSR